VIVLCVGWCGRHANEAVPSSSASFLSPCTVIYKSIAVLLSRFFYRKVVVAGVGKTGVRSGGHAVSGQDAENSELVVRSLKLLRSKRLVC
jgi:hypothetical protein